MIKKGKCMVLGSDLGNFEIEYNEDKSIITKITATRNHLKNGQILSQVIDIYKALLDNASKLDRKIKGKYQFEDLIEGIVSKLYENKIEEEQIKRLIGDFTNKVNEIYLIKKMALSLGLSGKFKINEQNQVIKQFHTAVTSWQL